jgi:hypothetical protein
MSFFRHHSAKEKALLTTPVPASGTVPLHELCEQCGRFAKEWKVTSWLQERREQPVPSWPASRMCSVTQLAQSAKGCHLCRFVLASLERRSDILGVRSFDGLNVYLKAHTKNGVISSVAALLATKEPVGEGEGKHFASFMLGTYHGELHDVYMRCHQLMHPDRDPQTGAFNGNIIAREIPVRANDNVFKAKQWLQTCLHIHTECREFHANTVRDPHQRPTRVLEITSKGLRLRCDMQAQSFEYLVLSYMWGTNHTQQLRLLQANLQAFQREIPRAKFEASDIYKEAIRVTLALGYRYLWIDSLCIIQDSDPDWDYEACRMAIVYGNAVCNLAFLFPPHYSPAKPTTRDDPRVWNPCILRPATSSRPGVYIEHMKTELRNDFQNDERYTDWLVQRNWPLFNRAWTFQEYLLSPRTLLIGHKNLMWQCSTLFYDELLGPIAQPQDTTPTDPKRGKDRGKSRYFPSSIRLIKKATSFSDPAVLSFMQDWQNVVNEYRSRSLSCSKDRIIAFAGIARAFSTLGKLTYLGGLWKEVLPIALLWYMDRKPPPLVRRENQMPKGELPLSTWTLEVSETVAHTAPSWSWFSIPIYRYYQQFFLFSDDELFIRCKRLSNPELVCWTDIFWAQVSSFHFPTHAANHVSESSFFNFKNLQITLAMLVLPVKTNWPADLASQMQALQSNGPFCWDPVLAYYPDDPAGRMSPPRNAIYALVAEFQVVRTAGKNTVQRRLAGLMLVPGRNEGTWKRVGVWKLRINISNVYVGKEGIAGVAKKWRGVSVVSEKWQYALITMV